MGFREREARRVNEQERVLSNIIDTVISSKEELLAPIDRSSLRGTTTKINHRRDTFMGFGLIKEVDFTITDGTTVQWDETLQAAIAYGLIQDLNEMVCTGGIFERTNLETLNLNPQDIINFPSLIYETPGHFNTLRTGLAFRIHPTSSYDWSLTFGTPVVQKEVPFSTPQLQDERRNNSNPITRYLERVVQGLFPRK